ncbi:hypothetical protein TEA_003288 [Camellia sinensis var. sinensis]|uniref:Uncharacterized protein n=1 Tax=Camellia sinensis var. sinensis TaxID=542762 RepID=A0A4S4DN47_CAMSN|nr:hypothetical protein TEA_003288 [Camellia sinensis var. sinensis]
MAGEKKIDKSEPVAAVLKSDPSPKVAGQDVASGKGGTPTALSSSISSSGDAISSMKESILRYGLPPSFLLVKPYPSLLSIVLAPSVKSEKKARSILEELCDSANSTYWKSEDGGMGGLGGDADAYPYVSFTTNLV